MKLFTMDLQRFAEEVAPSPSGSVEINPESFATGTMEEKVAQLAALREAENAPVEVEEETETAEAEKPPVVETEPAKEPPKLSADSFENINPDELPPELKPLYKNMEKLFQQKSQQMSVQLKALESITQKEPEKPNPLAQIERMEKEAAQLAMNFLGITDPDEFVPDSTGVLGNKTHFAAYQSALNFVSTQDFQRSQVESRVQQIAQFAVENPAVEKQFDDAMFALAVTDREKFQQVFAAKQRFVNRQATMQDVDVIENHFKDMMKPAPAKPVPEKVTVKPPAVEKAGTGVTETKQSLDLSEWSGADRDKQIAMFSRARALGQV